MNNPQKIRLKRWKKRITKRKSITLDSKINFQIQFRKTTIMYFFVQNQPIKLNLKKGITIFIFLYSAVIVVVQLFFGFLWNFLRFQYLNKNLWCKCIEIIDKMS